MIGIPDSGRANPDNLGYLLGRWQLDPWPALGGIQPPIQKFKNLVYRAHEEERVKNSIPNV